MRTYSAESWQQAKQAWADAYSDESEWAEVRQLAAQAGLLFPPAHPTSELQSDEPDTGRPSQRALLLRYMRSDHELVRYALTSRAHKSWHDVLAIVLEEVQGARSAAKQAEREYRQTKASYATHREAAASIANIMQTLADSVGTPAPEPVIRGAAVKGYHDELVSRAAHFHDDNHAAGAWWLCTDAACAAMRWLLDEEDVPMASQ